MLIALIPKPMFGQLFNSNTHGINTVFTTGQNQFWKYRREMNKVLDKRLRLEETFCKSNHILVPYFDKKKILKYDFKLLNQTLDTFLQVYGSVHFDVRDPCNEKRSKIFCQKSTKFSNFVLTFGILFNGTEGYIAFRLKDDQTLERVTAGI